MSTAITPPVDGSEGTAKEKSTYGARSFIGDFFWGVILSLAALLAILMVVIPLIMGVKPNTVLTQSMEPTIKAGDVVMVKPAADVPQFSIGDIVQVGQADHSTVTHRLIGIGVKGTGKKDYLYTTQGDNNTKADEPVPYNHLAGKVVNFPGTSRPYVIPKLGYVKNYPIPFAILALLVGLLMLWSFFTDGKEKKDKTRLSTEEENRQLEHKKAQEAELEAYRSRYGSLQHDASEGATAVGPMEETE